MPVSSSTRKTFVFRILLDIPKSCPAWLAWQPRHSSLLLASIFCQPIASHQDNFWQHNLMWMSCVYQLYFRGCSVGCLRQTDCAQNASWGYQEMRAGLVLEANSLIILTGSLLRINWCTKTILNCFTKLLRHCYAPLAINGHKLLRCLPLAQTTCIIEPR